MLTRDEGSVRALPGLDQVWHYERLGNILVAAVNVRHTVLQGELVLFIVLEDYVIWAFLGSGINILGEDTSGEDTRENTNG